MFKCFSPVYVYVYCSGPINIFIYSYVYKPLGLVFGIIKDYDFASNTLRTLTHRPLTHLSTTTSTPADRRELRGTVMACGPQTNDVPPPRAINVHRVVFPLISHLINYVVVDFCARTPIMFMAIRRIYINYCLPPGLRFSWKLVFLRGKSSNFTRRGCSGLSVVKMLVQRFILITTASINNVLVNS